MTTPTLLLGRDASSPLDVVRLDGHDHILSDRRVALCDRRVPKNAAGVEGLADCCPERDRLHAELEPRQLRDRRRSAPRLRVL